MRARLFVLLLCLSLSFPLAALAQVELAPDLKKLEHPKDAVAESSAAMQGVQSASFSAPGKPGEIIGFYKKNLQDQGWTVVFEQSTQEAQLLGVQKEKAALTVSAQAKEGGSSEFVLVFTTAK